MPNLTSYDQVKKFAEEESLDMVLVCEDPKVIKVTNFKRDVYSRLLQQSQEQVEQ